MTTFRISVFGAAALLMTAAEGAAAATYVLDFSGPICGGVCTDSAVIDQSYGDVAGEVDVTYDGDTAVTTPLQSVRFWSDGFGPLAGVAYAFNQQQITGISIRFTAAPGKLVTINSFDIAPFDVVGGSFRSQVLLLDTPNATEDLSENLTLASFSGKRSFSKPSTPGAWTSTEMAILLGPDANNVAIDNISFTVSDANGGGGGGVNPVPLPAAGWLLLGGLGALGAAARRRG